MSKKTKEAFCVICDKNVNAIKESETMGCGGHFGFAIISFFGLILFFPVLIVTIPAWCLCAMIDTSKFRCHICQSDKLERWR